ncbi:MAG: cysteine hydrolase [Anaerolineae bacterium]|nr:cysteine hydrolase [Anaerolineae bacterium]
MRSPGRDWKPFALLLIDVQQDFWGDEMAKSFPTFPLNIGSLLGLCRTEGIEVIHLRASFTPDMSDWMLKYKLRGRIPCVQGTPGIETMSFALDEPGEVVIVKHTFDGFHGTGLLEYLRQQGKRFVLTAGLVTSTCVLFTTVSAAQNGFLTAVVADCCADEPSAHEQTLDRYQFIFDRTTLDAIPASHRAWLVDLEKLDQPKAKTQKPQGT